MRSAKLGHTSPSKAATGILGLDEITGGGLPRGTATLIEGGPGSGKTILALQSLVNGARKFNEPGIFVAFEESSKSIIANAAAFNWQIASLHPGKLFLLDAQPPLDLVQSGRFDLGGMLAAIDSKAREIGARRVVLDALDIVLTLLDDPAAERAEVLRLHEWLRARDLTSIITAKSWQVETNETRQHSFGFMQFMVDCSIALDHRIVEGISQRILRILKYRGSSFEENDVPFVIGREGLEVAGTRALERNYAPVTNERVSSGVKRLDVMLGGGYFRGASVLITGFPGTAKSTLCGSFAEAACERGERTMFVSFDSDSSELIRNLDSVHVRLQRFVKKGLLRLVPVRAISGSAEIHLMHIKNLAREHRARCVVIDPVSALSKLGNEGAAHGVAERLIDWAKTHGITLVCTSLLDDSSPSSEGSPLKVSTIADTWIHLNYLVVAGERNRGLSIIKSRGTAHSNQVRELILSKTGIALADAYTAGGEVLMGTMRWEKEMAERKEHEERALVAKKRLLQFDTEEADLQGRLTLLQRQLEANRAEKEILDRLAATEERERKVRQATLSELRGADPDRLGMK
jgi:circadian clock protein KaiC